MEGHHSLNFEAALPHHLYDLLVCRPVIVSRSVLLHNSPPDVHHDALHTRALERHQACVQSPSPGHGVVHAHAVQRQHDEHGHATSGTFASRGLLEGILLPRPKLCLPVEDGLPEIFRVCCTSVDLANSELRGFLHGSVVTSPAAQWQPWTSPAAIDRCSKRRGKRGRRRAMSFLLMVIMSVQDLLWPCRTAWLLYTQQTRSSSIRLWSVAGRRFRLRSLRAEAPLRKAACRQQYGVIATGDEDRCHDPSRFLKQQEDSRKNYIKTAITLAWSSCNQQNPSQQLLLKDYKNKTSRRR